MFITSEEVLIYLEEFCENVDCPHKVDEVCPDTCPVAVAISAIYASNGDTMVFDTER